MRIPYRKTFLPLSLMLLALGGLYGASIYNYDLFHSLASLFSIAIALGIFILVWTSRNHLGNNYLLFIGIAYMFIGGLQMAHANLLKYRLNIKVQSVTDNDKRDIILPAVVNKIIEARPHFNMPTGKVLQALYRLVDEPVLPPVTFFNRDAALSISSLDTFPVAVSKVLPEKNA